VGSKEKYDWCNWHLDPYAYPSELLSTVTRHYCLEADTTHFNKTLSQYSKYTNEYKILQCSFEC